MIAHDVLEALADLKEGRVRLSAEQYTDFLDAVGGLVRALIEAQPSLAAELERTRAEELRLLRELQGNLSR
jgi:hypothetical protein